MKWIYSEKLQDFKTQTLSCLEWKKKKVQEHEQSIPREEEQRFFPFGLKWKFYFQYVLNYCGFLSFEKELNIFSFQTQKVITCISLSMAMYILAYTQNK